jgi:hypothetical protein
MSIGVQSFPELYTTLMGWHLYDQLWNLLSKTGLAFLPFIGMLLRNIGQPYTSQETKDAPSTSLRRVEVDLFMMLSLIFFGASPVMAMNPTLISYTPVCQTQGQNNTYHPGDTGTTWDKAFTLPIDDARVPIWWYAVMSVSEGFASSANTMVSCIPDLRKMVTEVNTTQITDPALKQEVQQFEENCYIPARTQYLQDTHANSPNTNAINDARKQYGDDDADWLGSHGFQQTYYQNLHAQQPVQGFPYNQAEDINAESNKSNPPAYGTPDCNTWWNDPQNGLKTRVYNALPQNFSEYQSFFQNDDKGTLKDSVIKNIVSHVDNGYQAANTTIGDDGYSHFTSAIGSWFSQLTTYPKLYAAAQAAPIIQALLLLMIYTFLPFALVFTGYKPSAFITGAILIFSMIFWSFIWHLVTYVDTTLMNALYGDSWFSQQTPQATLADMITAILIIVAPLFWFSFMGAMGVAVGDVVSKAFGGMSEVGDNAAKEGAGLVKSGAKASVGIVKKGVAKL